MISLNRHIIEVDNDSFCKTETGLIYRKMGEKHSMYHQNAKVLLPKQNSKLKKGDEIIYLHFAINNPVLINQKTYYGCEEDWILAKKQNGEWESNTHLFVEKITTEEKTTNGIITDIGGKEIPANFKVLKSNSKDYSVDDKIFILQDHDYPIPYPEMTLVDKKVIIKNLTTNELKNGYEEVSEIKDETKLPKKGLLDVDTDTNYLWVVYNHTPTLFMRSDAFKMPCGNFAVKKENMILQWN